MMDQSPFDIIRARVDRENTEKQAIAETRALVVSQEIMSMLEVVPDLIKADEYRYCIPYEWDGETYVCRKLDMKREKVYVGGIPLKVLFNERAESLVVLDATPSWMKFKPNGVATEDLIREFALVQYDLAATTAGVLRLQIERTNPDSEYKKELADSQNGAFYLSKHLNAIRDQRVRQIINSEQIR